MRNNNGIGGYLELERFSGEPYRKNVVALNCGRGCLAYLVELRGIERVWLPDFMCDSVPALFKREGVEIKTYTIGADLLPVYDFDIADGEWMLLADYYGQLQQSDVETAKGFSGNRLIVDETQGFFRAPWEGCDTVYSCRKWFGVSDGGYLAASDGARLSRKLERDESHMRMAHVLGRFERSSSEFYADACANNEFFAGEPAKAMSLITENILHAVDYESVRKKRNANWDVLHEVLSHKNQMSLQRPEVAFMYPFCCGEKAQTIRQKLIESKIFIPMLWPNVKDDCAPETVAYRYATETLPLPVDQRYGGEEMERIVSEVMKCL